MFDEYSDETFPNRPGKRERALMVPMEIIGLCCRGKIAPLRVSSAPQHNSFKVAMYSPESDANWSERQERKQRSCEGF